MTAEPAYESTNKGGRESLLMRFLRRLVLGEGKSDTAGYYVGSESWPSSSKETAITPEEARKVLDDAFDNYFDSAMEALAKVEVRSSSSARTP